MKTKIEHSTKKDKSQSRAIAESSRLSNASVVLMPMLQVGSPGDRFEQQADRVAGQIMQMPDSVKNPNQEEFLHLKRNNSRIAPWLHRIDKTSIRRSKQNGGEPGIAWIEQQLNKTKGTGVKLPDAPRSFMEKRFGASFGNVSIHTGNHAAMLNRALNAQAFTHGNDIYFDKGKYNPQSKAGKHLLAHELTHVIQQNGASPAVSKIQRSDETKDVADISTPIPKDLEADDAGEFHTTINGISITIQPDEVSDEEGSGAETHINHKLSYPKYDWEDGRVVSFEPPKISAILKTTYQKDAKKSADSLYGRGTTAEDKKAGNTSLRFHEGSHGTDFLKYMKNNAPPKFEGKNGDKVEDFKKKIAEYDNAVNDYFKKMNRDSELSTDCVGKTIDEATESNICPE